MVNRCIMSIIIRFRPWVVFMCTSAGLTPAETTIHNFLTINELPMRAEGFLQRRVIKFV